MLGLSGISSDFRELLPSDDRRARFAIEMFCYRVPGHIAAVAAALGGLDGIVFTAGVGEKRGADVQRDLPRLWLAGFGARRGRQPGEPLTHQYNEQPHCRLCHQD